MNRFVILASATLATLASMISSNAALAQSAASRGSVWYNGTEAPLRYHTNTANRINSVERIGVGQYKVSFTNLGSSGGNVQVSAYGGNHRCNVVDWNNIGGTLLANVACVSPNGQPIDGMFTAMFEKASPSQYFPKAYVWANQESATGSYTPDLSYQFNSRGLTNTIQRVGVGSYDVRLAGMNQLGGNVLVSSYGNQAKHCKVNYWNVSGNDTVARVNCFNAAGQVIDSKFSLNYQKGDSLSNDVYSDLYAWSSSTGSISPVYAHNGSYGSGVLTGSNPSIGNYVVTLPANLSGYKTTAFVTAYGGDAAHCNISSWNTNASANTSQANISCFNPQGQAVNSAFTFRMITNAVVPQ
jgi:hypothetical protein